MATEPWVAWVGAVIMGCFILFCACYCQHRKTLQYFRDHPDSIRRMQATFDSTRNVESHTVSYSVSGLGGHCGADGGGADGCG